MSDTPRTEAEARVMDAGRALGAAAVLFHAAVAGRMGLTAVEEKALDVVARWGPVTAGDLSSATGLAPSSVTALIDRLVRKGFVVRVPDTDDARRVRVAQSLERLRRDHPDLDRLPIWNFADTTGSLIDALGIRSDEGVPLRATFIVDPDGTIQHVYVTNLNVGRNPEDTLRVLDALQTDELCPCNRQVGGETLAA